MTRGKTKLTNSVLSGDPVHSSLQWRALEVGGTGESYRLMHPIASIWIPIWRILTLSVYLHSCGLNSKGALVSP